MFDDFSWIGDIFIKLNESMWCQNPRGLRGKRGKSRVCYVSLLFLGMWAVLNSLGRSDLALTVKPSQWSERLGFSTWCLLHTCDLTCVGSKMCVWEQVSGDGMEPPTPTCSCLPSLYKTSSSCTLWGILPFWDFPVWVTSVRRWWLWPVCCGDLWPHGESICSKNPCL